MQCTFIAHRIRISDILSWVRNSYLNHVILPKLLCGVSTLVSHYIVYYIFAMPFKEILGNKNSEFYGEQEKEFVITRQAF